MTYTVEIATDNADLKLLPYLTASVKFDVAHRDKVFAAPNAALRWAPRGADSPELAGRGGKVEGEMRAATVWTFKDGQPQMLAVKAGLSDGVNTEIEGDGVADGLEVVLGEKSADQTASAATNPFAPPMMRGGNRPGGAGGTGGQGGAGGAGGTGGGRPAGGGGGR